MLLVLGATARLLLFTGDTLQAQRPAKPNIIVILADDLGYGDLSSYGHPVISTPNLDRLAREGQRWTSFYASSSVCNPSRAALMSGRMPARIHGGLNRWSDLPPSEITIAEMLKPLGYATACIGKWHLGMGQGSHPNDQGFDYFYGTPGSNDAPLRKGVERTYANTKNATFDMYDFPLQRQRETIETPVRQTLLTQRYTAEAVRWIRENKQRPFFLYLAHNMPHVPVFRSKRFEGKSLAGLYGDVIEEIDWSVGRIVQALEAKSLSKNTLVVFTSDNGPWRTYFDLGGSAGPLRDGKMTAWEGGFRVPGIFWWPGTVQPAVVRGIGANVDFIATFASLTDAKLPQDRTFDSIDLSATLLNRKPSARTSWFYYGHPSGELWAARVGRYKIHLQSKETIGTEKIGWRGYGEEQKHDPPLLFDLHADVMESRNIAAERPQQIAKIRQAIDEHRKSIGRR